MKLPLSISGLFTTICLLSFTLASSADTKTHAFPEFPKAQGKIMIQELVSIGGSGYCEVAASAKDMKPISEETKNILTKELQIASRVCQGSIFKKFPGVPDDSNLQQIVDVMFLQQGLFAFYVSLRDLPGEDIVPQMHMNNLKTAESLLWIDLEQAYPGESLLKPMTEVFEWVRTERQQYERGVGISRG